MVFFLLIKNACDNGFYFVLKMFVFSIGTTHEIIDASKMLINRHFYFTGHFKLN